MDWLNVAAAIAGILGAVAAVIALSKSNLRVLGLILAGCALFAAGYLVVGAIAPDPWHRISRSATSTTSAVATQVVLDDSIKNASKVPEHDVVLFGVVSGLAPGHVLWAAHRPTTTDQYYPADWPCTITGSRFTCPPMKVGTDDDTRDFQLVVFDAAPDGQQALIAAEVSAAVTNARSGQPPQAVSVTNVLPGAPIADWTVKPRKPLTN
jgi:hypothetical protein